MPTPGSGSARRASSASMARVILDRQAAWRSRLDDMRRTPAARWGCRRRRSLVGQPPGSSVEWTGIDLPAPGAAGLTSRRRPVGASTRHPPPRLDVTGTTCPVPVPRSDVTDLSASEPVGSRVRRCGDGDGGDGRRPGPAAGPAPRPGHGRRRGGACTDAASTGAACAPVTRRAPAASLGGSRCRRWSAPAGVSGRYRRRCVAAGRRRSRPAARPTRPAVSDRRRRRQSPRRPGATRHGRSSAGAAAVAARRPPPRSSSTSAPRPARVRSAVGSVPVAPSGMARSVEEVRRRVVGLRRLGHVQTRGSCR